MNVLTTLLLLLATAGSACAATVRYVWQGSPSPAPPYASWATAAQTIQLAVDAAVAGDEIVVTNGTYATGGRAVFGLMTNRVAVTKQLAVRSVNGPEWTTIQGYQVPGSTNGDGAIRCVYLTNGASLSGFTLINGATHQATGREQEDCGGAVWCESASAVLTNCVLAGNSADGAGGGAYRGTLNNCRLLGNSVPGGNGGGAASANLNYCTLTGNTARGSGGGTDDSTLNNCTLTGNWAGSQGGGANYSVMNNCSLSGNTTPGGGGGAAKSVLTHCTVTGNSANYGGGVAGGGLTNCIIYFNTATVAANYGDSPGIAGGLRTITLNHSCTAPLPFAGLGNIALDPQLASASHLSANSPCRGAGSAADTTGTDIDGEAWGNPPSIGCDEYHAGAVTGPLAVSITATFTNVATGYGVGLTALIEGRTTASAWDLADEAAISNRPYATHAWTTPGDYAVVLRAYNENHPAGVSATQRVQVVAQPVHYVAATSPSPSSPYASWATAARTIQAAIDAATVTGALVLVSNGVYASGGRVVYGTLLNRVAVTKPATVQSVNGPEFTVIRGYQVPGTTNGDGAVRCVYLTNGACLSGFTLTKGATLDSGDYRLQQWGGGLWCESASAVVTNCVLEGNASRCNGAGAYGGTLNDCILIGNVTGSGNANGGGAYSAALNHCTLSNNVLGAIGYGGGAGGCELNDCTVVGNSGAYYGGGAMNCIMNRCLVAGNSGFNGGGAYGSLLNNCTLKQNFASAPWGPTEGGGAFGCRLNRCLLTGNWAAGDGGGVGACELNNCTLVANWCTRYGGGASSATLNNCIVYFNSAADGADYYQAQLNYCCTSLLPADGVGNITLDPLFVNAAGDDLRLQTDSPCINAGRNAYASSPMDLDGNPRIVSSTVDIGAYEFQGTGSLISYAWLQQYNLPTDGSADFLDPDVDGHDTWQEWRCLTVPTNGLSVLRLLSASPTGSDVTVSWQSVAGVNYFLERSTNLASPLLFTPLATVIPGQPGTTTFTDTNAFTAPHLFYRVGVGN